MAIQSTDNIPTARLAWDCARAAYVPATKAAVSKPAAYLSGPIPMDWLAQAHTLGGNA